MKAILLIILAIVWFIPYCIFGWAINIANNNQWKNDIYSNWELSDRASTLDKKYDYLIKFKESLVANGLDSGYAGYVIKNPSNDLSLAMESLDSLITRVEEAKSLSATSLEYQQAIKQITTDEYQGFNTCVFAGGWTRKNLWRWMNTLFISCQNGEYSGSSD